MQKLEKLLERVIRRVNLNRGPEFRCRFPEAGTLQSFSVYALTNHRASASNCWKTGCLRVLRIRETNLRRRRLSLPRRQDDADQDDHLNR
jgi:hypothetical protein